MAVVARAFFSPASQEDHDRLDAAIDARIAEAGGPPDGLMAMVTHPQDDGFWVIQVFRNESTLTAFVQGVCLPAIEELGIGVSSLEVDRVWAFARP